MFPTFLITFREVIEASIIVFLTVGVLKRLNHHKSIRIVWIAAALAFATSLLLVFLGSLFGIKVHSLYENNEAYVEGTLMFLSAIFITWAVFYLHRFSSIGQRKLASKINTVSENIEKRGLFILVFSSVFREGIEVALFLATIYFTSSPVLVVSGFLIGTVVGVAISYLAFRLTQKANLSLALKIANLSLIIFSGGLLLRGIHEFTEVGLIPELGNIVLDFIPPSTTLLGGSLKSLLGLTGEINAIQLTVYFIYIFILTRFVLYRKQK